MCHVLQLGDLHGSGRHLLPTLWILESEGSSEVRALPSFDDSRSNARIQRLPVPWETHEMVESIC